MLPKFLVLLVVGALVALACGVDYSLSTHAWVQQRVSAESAEQKNTAQAVPDFSFEDIDQSRAQSLRDFAGSPVIINFWATWCAPCVAELPMLIALADAQRDVKLLLISQDSSQKTIDDFLERLRRNNPSLPALKTSPNIFVVWDENKRISHNLFQTYKLPETWIITPAQTLGKKIVGLASADDVRRALLQK
ncbi:MAG: TlpA family protein disulfide reductase [Alphaproteobacteria bacterium]|nr:TlpA family protein disulfide reductase [Alphaproteobacteria bacterium]NDG03938.1 TlpA family protein disulfide reductase [Alphaproteobacteria bacterium]